MRTISVAFLLKLSKSVHVCQSYSKPNVGRFLTHGVVINVAARVQLVINHFGGPGGTIGRLCVFMFG